MAVSITTAKGHAPADKKGLDYSVETRSSIAPAAGAANMWEGALRLPYRKGIYSVTVGIKSTLTDGSAFERSLVFSASVVKPEHRNTDGMKGLLRKNQVRPCGRCDARAALGRNASNTAEIGQDWIRKGSACSMPLRLMIADEAAQIGDFLLRAKLRRPVVLTPLAGRDLSFDIRGLGEPAPCGDTGGLQSREFSGPGGPTDPLTLGSRPGSLSLIIGRPIESRSDAVQILLSSTRTGLGDRFGQLDLSHCLADDRAVYLTKILSKDGGEGAIVRLRSGTNRLEEREYRRQRLAEAMGSDRIIEFAGETHLVVSTLTFRELRRRSSSAMARFLSDFLRYAALVELIRTDKDLIVDKKNSSRLRPPTAGSAYAPALTTPERLRINTAAMEEARRWLAERHFDIEDVADKRLGYDLSAYNLTGRLKVAVKGTTVEDWTIDLSPLEYDSATKHGDDYLLLVVQLEDLTSLKPVKVTPLPDPVNAPGYSIASTGYALRQKS